MRNYWMLILLAYIKKKVAQISAKKKFLIKDVYIIVFSMYLGSGYIIKLHKHGAKSSKNYFDLMIHKEKYSISLRNEQKKLFIPVLYIYTYYFGPKLRFYCQ